MILLNVHAVLPRTRSNGPGLRAAVWVQGCTVGCPGCFNVATHTHERRRLWHPERLAERLVRPEIDGISILGGEPFEQAEACAALARAARALGGNVLTYSGYRWERLRRSLLPEVWELIAASDALVTGPYVAARRTTSRPYVGSENQEIILRTDSFSAEDFAPRSAAAIEGFSDGATTIWTGIGERGSAADEGTQTMPKVVGSSFVRIETCDLRGGRSPTSVVRPPRRAPMLRRTR